jgi:hypothetical protein
MIDCENEVFTKIFNELRPRYPTALFASVETLSPATYPCISIVMFDNPLNMQAYDLSGNENAANSNFEINVFSNKANTAKTEAKGIFNAVDDLMRRLGFIRNSYAPITLTSNNARLVGRYRKIVCK